MRTVKKTRNVFQIFKAATASLLICTGTIVPLFGGEETEISNPPPQPSPESASLEEILAYAEAQREWLSTLSEEEQWQWSQKQYYKRSVWPPNSEEYLWQLSAYNAGLSVELIRKLNAEGFIVSRDITFKQSFEAYTSPEEIPFFITTDSILNGYHVLLEASMQRAAIQEARMLRSFLLRMYDALGKPEDKRDFNALEHPEILEHCQRVLGPALVLLGEDPKFFSKQVKKDVHEIVRRIEEANSVWMPPWLSPKTDDFLAIDFRRMKPVGFYTRAQLLENYFKALTWLRAVPFRIDRIIEFEAYGVMADIGFRQHEPDLEYLDRLSSFFGPSNGLNIKEAGTAFQNFSLHLKWDGHESARNFALAMLQGKGNFPIERINDSWSLIPREEAENQTYNLYLFTPRILPDNLLFQQILDDTHRTRPLPSGIDVAVFLGSKWAQDQYSRNDQILELISSKRKVRKSAYEKRTNRFTAPDPEDKDKPDGSDKIYADIENIYAKYLYVLEALFQEPEPEAPAWMDTKAWSRKNTETALASWAQMRHTLSLVATRNAFYLGMISAPPGFVEPNPEFYGRLAALVRETRQILDYSNVFNDASADAIFSLQRDLAFIQQNIDTEGNLYGTLSKDKQESWRLQMHSLQMEHEIAFEYENEALSMKELEQSRKLLMDKLKQAEAASTDPSIDNGSDHLRNRWNTLLEMVLMLESLSHKQLRGQGWSNREAEFIRNYGKRLAGVMLYSGNSWLTPVDDAPRIIGVHENPQVKQILHVGIGRPQAIFALYPWKGQQILCRGSIMPYYEFPADHWLTDTEWLEIETETEQPSWLID